MSSTDHPTILAADLKVGMKFKRKDHGIRFTQTVTGVTVTDWRVLVGVESGLGITDVWEFQLDEEVTLAAPPLTKYLVTELRTEKITYSVMAPNPEEAEQVYYMDGEEEMSITKDVTVVNVEEAK